MVGVTGMWRISLCATLLPFFRSPHGPAHVRLRRVSSLWTCEAAVLHTGLSLPCSSRSATLCSGRERRLRPYPWGLIFPAGAFSILYLLLSWCSRCARSCTVQVPSEQPCLLDWLTRFLDLLVRIWTSVLDERGRDNETLVHFQGVTNKQVSVLQISGNLLLAFYLECGSSSVSLISSGLTKCCNSSVFSTDTLSRSRLSLCLSNRFNLEKEEQAIRTRQIVLTGFRHTDASWIMRNIFRMTPTHLFFNCGFASNSTQCATVASRQQ